MEWNGVISVPGVAYRLLGSTRHGTSLLKRGLGVMGLSCCVGIDCRSTVRRGLPFFFGLMTMRWHQVTGVLGGTSSMTPSLQSWSRPAFTSSCQCIGTGMGFWCATGCASGSTINRSGGPSMVGRGWWLHTLNVLEE